MAFARPKRIFLPPLVCVAFEDETFEVLSSKIVCPLTDGILEKEIEFMFPWKFGDGRIEDVKAKIVGTGTVPTI